MKLNSTGIAGVTLVLAGLLGGVAGGALVLGNDGSAPAPRPVEMGLKTAAETDTPPTVETTIPDSEEAPVTDTPEAETPVSAEISDGAVSRPSAPEAETEAPVKRKPTPVAPVDDAEPAPAATPEPVATPKPWVENPVLGGECRAEGAHAKRGDDGPAMVCDNGVWRLDEPAAPPTSTDPSGPSE